MRRIADAERLRQFMADLGRTCRVRYPAVDPPTFRRQVDQRGRGPAAVTLYRLLATEHGNGAHSRYNALIRSLVSFERAVARSKPAAR